MFELVYHFPRKFGLFKSKTAQYFLKPVDAFSETLPIKHVSQIVDAENVFVNRNNDSKIWGLDLNVSGGNWTPARKQSGETALISTEEEEYPEYISISGEPRVSLPSSEGVESEHQIRVEYCLPDLDFAENYEKMLTCFLASKIEQARVKRAFERKERRRRVAERLFTLEISKMRRERRGTGTGRENVSMLSNIEDTRDAGRGSGSVRKTLFHDQTQNMINSQSGLFKGRKGEEGSRGSFGERSKRSRVGSDKQGGFLEIEMLKERKRELLQEIGEMFENEGRTLWNYGLSQKIKTGLLAELEGFFLDFKNERVEGLGRHAGYQEALSEMKQTIEAGV